MQVLPSSISQLGAMWTPPGHFKELQMKMVYMEDQGTRQAAIRTRAHTKKTRWEEPWQESAEKRCTEGDLGWAAEGVPESTTAASVASVLRKLPLLRSCSSGPSVHLC